MSARHDVVIVGGGLAGLTTALRAAELGRAPVLLEQGEAEDYPCNSRFAGGIVHVAFKDLQAPASELGAAVAALAGASAATGRAPVLAAEGARALVWMRGHGARFVRGGALEFMRWVLAPPRPRRPGLDWKGRGPDVLLRGLSARLRAAGGTIERGVRARELLLGEAGGVRGVVASKGDRAERLEAGAVVIADGGFQGNPELVRRFICARPDRLLARGAATGRGDGLLMAEAAGAALVGTDRFYGHLLGREAFANERLWPYPTADAVAQASLVVGPDGRRFLDEGRGGVYMANEVARLADPLAACVVFDERVWSGVAADNRYPPCMNPAFVRAGGTVLEAASLAELAARLALPPGALERTVREHNEALRAGRAGDLAPPRTTHPHPPQPLDAPPFRAIRICAGITYTMGGIAVDDDGRVRHRDGGPIGGLYAAGSAAGGFEGGPGAIYLGGLARAVVTGLRAAEAVAAVPA